MEDEINSNENTKNYNQFAQKPPQISVAVVVLGEIGRSPRMQYHSLSLAEQLNCKVEIIGYGKKSECRKELQSHKNIEFHSISDDIPEIAKKHFILRAFYRLFVTFFRLFFALWSLSTPDYILVQVCFTLKSFKFNFVLESSCNSKFISSSFILFIKRK